MISGDFTQRARTEQFGEACEFLDRLRERGHEVLGVPGNHDVPLYDVLRRFLSPLTRYRRFIDDSLCPFIELPGVAVLGINTARSLTFKDGRISDEQIDFIRETFARTAPDATRILVTHHPLFAVQVGDRSRAARLAGARWRWTRSSEAGVDLLLAGHATTPRCTRRRSRDAGRRRAGDPGRHRDLDPRPRTEQSFNVIDIADGRVALTVECWGGDDFSDATIDRRRQLRICHEGRLAHY